MYAQWSSNNKREWLYKHCISDSNTELVNEFKDLGIVIDTKFYFSLRSEMLKNNAIAILDSSSVYPWFVSLEIRFLVFPNLEHLPFNPIKWTRQINTLE